MLLFGALSQSREARRTTPRPRPPLTSRPSPVRPEIAADYITADNLINRGAAFVKAFTDEAVRLAKKQ